MCSNEHLQLSIQVWLEKHYVVLYLSGVPALKMYVQKCCEIRPYWCRDASVFQSQIQSLVQAPCVYLLLVWCPMHWTPGYLPSPHPWCIGHHKSLALSIMLLNFLPCLSKDCVSHAGRQFKWVMDQQSYVCSIVMLCVKTINLYINRQLP